MKEIDKNKKIRIVSFQNARNFGAVCQAYGLQQTLLDMGYEDVMFINYNPQYLKDRYNPWLTWGNLNLNTSFIRKISRIIRWLSFVLTTHVRNVRIERSIKRMLKQTKGELHHANEVAAIETDVLICGSDQIWNTALTGILDPVYFGLARYGEKEKIISYAPSTEISSLTNETISQMAKCLTEFSHVSVREESVREILQPQVSNPIMVTVDPTILCGRKAFDNVASKRLERKPYICVYAYTPDEELVQKTIKTIPNYTQFEVHYILFSATNLSQWKNKTIHSALTIEDFLSYIKYASYIVTNSFHGLAFSLLFERNFNVTWMDNKSTRTEALLKELKLSNRLIRDANNAKWSNLDYKKVNVELDMICNESREYLSNSIND